MNLYLKHTQTGLLFVLLKCRTRLITYNCNKNSRRMSCSGYKVCPYWHFQSTGLVKHTEDIITFIQTLKLISNFLLNVNKSFWVLMTSLQVFRVRNELNFYRIFSNMLFILLLENKLGVGIKCEAFLGQVRTFSLLSHADPSPSTEGPPGGSACGTSSSFGLQDKKMKLWAVQMSNIPVHKSTPCTPCKVRLDTESSCEHSANYWCKWVMAVALKVIRV